MDDVDQDSEDHEDNRAYSVVANDEEQYSIWLDGQPLPDGWISIGFTGSRDECLDHVAAVWTDMRPKSLREAMDARLGR